MALIAFTETAGGSINTTGADLIVGVVCTTSGGGISDNFGNAYTVRPVIGYSYAGLTWYLQVFYCLVPTVGAGHSFTPSGTSAVFAVSAYSGGPYTVGAVASNAQLRTTSISAGSLTPVGANAIVVVALNCQPNSPTAPPSGFTALGSFGVAVQYYQQQTSAATVNPTITFAALSNAAIQAVIFEVAATNVNVPQDSTFVIGMSAGVSVTGSTDVPDTSAFTIGFAAGVSLSGGSANQPQSSAFSIGIDMAVSVLPTSVNVPFDFGFGLNFSAADTTPSLAITCPLSTAFVGIPYSEVLGVSGGTAPYTWSLVRGTTLSNTQVITIGDSLTVGDTPPGQTPWPNQLAILATVSVLNYAADGATSTDVAGTQLTNALASFNPSLNNILTILAIVNDAGTGVPIATTQANYRTIISAAIARGFYVVCLTMTPSNYVAYPNYPAYIAQCVAMNTWLLAGLSGAHAVCDSGNAPELVDPSNGAYYGPDELHWRTAANAVVANCVANAITDRLPPGLSLSFTTGTIAGIPLSVGNYPYTVEVTDTNGIIGVMECEISVFSYGIAGSTLRFQMAAPGRPARWFSHSYANPSVVHYLIEPSAIAPNTQDLVHLSAGEVLLHGGNSDNGVPIQSVTTTPSSDQNDERAQKLYVDTMLDMDGSGTLQAFIQFNNQTVTGPTVFVTLSGSRIQSLENISSLADLTLYRNQSMTLSWTGGPDGPRVYAVEPSGFLQPYVSTFFVTQYLSLSYPGWKMARRFYPALISNAPVLFTVRTQDGRTFGPYSIPSTGGQLRILPMMFDQGLKDLAFAFQLDGQGVPFAFFPDDWWCEFKGWSDPNFIRMAIWKS